jgi:hypothetical protein
MIKSFIALWISRMNNLQPFHILPGHSTDYTDGTSFALQELYIKCNSMALSSLHIHPLFASLHKPRVLN